MKVRDHIAKFTDEFMDAEAVGVVLVGMCADAPMVVATMHPELAKKLLSMIVNEGDWSDLKRIQPH